MGRRGALWQLVSNPGHKASNSAEAKSKNHHTDNAVNGMNMNCGIDDRNRTGQEGHIGGESFEYSHCCLLSPTRHSDKERKHGP